MPKGKKAAEKPTPEIVKEVTGKFVTEHRNEYMMRVEALKSMHDSGTYNPPTDAGLLAKQAAEAARGVIGGPAMTPARDGSFNKRDPMRDAQAEAEARAKGWDGHATVETKGEQEGETGSDARGNAQVQTRDFEKFFRPQGDQSQAGDSHRVVGERAEPQRAIWCEQVFEAETEEAVRAMVPEGAKAVEVRMVYKATCLVRQG